MITNEILLCLAVALLTVSIVRTKHVGKITVKNVLAIVFALYLIGEFFVI